MVKAGLKFIGDEILGRKPGPEIQSGDDLLTSEIVDSMGVMRLVAFVEDTFDVKIPSEDVSLENFISVDAICKYLDSRNTSAADERIVRNVSSEDGQSNGA